MMAAVLTGARSQSLDVGQALLFKAKRFAGERQGAELIFREVRDRQNAPEQDKAAARAKMETARQALTEEMAPAVQSAQRLGLSQGEAVSALLAAGISQTDAALLLVGRYLPYVDRPFSREKTLQQTVRGR